MTTRQLVDPQAMVAPLLRACPGSYAITTCGLCGQTIVGLAALNERGGFEHADECPPPKPRPGMLL